MNNNNIILWVVVGLIVVGGIAIIIMNGMDTDDETMNQNTATTTNQATTTRATTTGNIQGVVVGGATMLTTKDLMENIGEADNVSTAVAAVKAAGLESTLKGAGPFTVFVPSNAAFSKLASGTVTELLKTENKPDLVNLLNYHVVAGRYTVADLRDGQTLTTILGQTLAIKKSANGSIRVNDIVVETPDIVSENGVAFVIDTVLTPSE